MAPDLDDALRPHIGDACDAIAHALGFDGQVPVERERAAMRLLEDFARRVQRDSFAILLAGGPATDAPTEPCTTRVGSAAVGVDGDGNVTIDRAPGD